MFVSGWKWQSGLKNDPLPSPAVLPVSVKENLDRKKNLPQLILAVISKKHKKMSHFDILMSITLEVNMINRQMTPFFSSNLLSSIRQYISILHFNTFKIQFNGVPPLHYAPFKPKMTLYRFQAEDDPFRAVNIYILIY